MKKHERLAKRIVELQLNTLPSHVRLLLEDIYDYLTDNSDEALEYNIKVTNGKKPVTLMVPPDVTNLNLILFDNTKTGFNPKVEPITGTTIHTPPRTLKIIELADQLNASMKAFDIPKHTKAAILDTVEYLNHLSIAYHENTESDEYNKNIKKFLELNSDLV